jgi:DNA mismatch endonuclease, patch repair protein
MGTHPERLLEQAFRELGLSFKRHVARLPGNPDLVFSAQRVAVFCDGDFWHGRHWAKRKAKLSSGRNADYWVAKINRNRARDRIVARELESLGWVSVRVWESDVRRAPDRVARIVAKRAGLVVRGCGM